VKEKEQYLGLLRQLKDFDENLARELAAKALQDQERKWLQVRSQKMLAVKFKYLVHMCVYIARWIEA